MTDSTAAALRLGAAASNHFALDLHARVGSKHENAFYSPASLSLALAMTALGARGETQAEMERVLRLDAVRDTPLQRAYSALHGHLATSYKSRDVELRSANRLWGQRGHGILPAFQEATRQHYGASLEEMDFAGDAEAARQRINHWVSQETREKIRELLARGTVDDQTRLVLTNAIYFRGRWEQPFEPELTEDGQTFHVSPKRRAKVSMMHQTDWFRHTEDEQAQWLELPYKGGEAAMLIALPKQLDGLAALESSLDAKLLEKRIFQLQGKEVVLTLPKFKLSAALQLKDVLSGLGMPLAFDNARADFSGITEREPMNLSAVVHQADLEVNEVGTEAAAATAMGMVASAAIRRTIDFVADHPFLFFIRDTWSGAVLFQGKLVNPQA